MLFKLLTIISIISINFCYVTSNSISSIQLYAFYNAQNHNTVKFDNVKPNSSSDLVLRRASTVFLASRLNQPLNPENEQLYLRLMFGPEPKENDGSIIILQVQKNPSNNGSWAAHSYEIKNNQVDFKLNIPSNAPVGSYRINFVLLENGQIKSEVTVPNSVYILFNPWSNSDSVFMQDPSDLDEYILNTFGVIYMGSVYNPEAREWYYDQFKKTALQTAVYVLDFLKLSTEQRADPIIVSRAISQMANSNDDNGVVFGKWTEPYTPDKAPWEWMSSGEILDQYVASGGQPVKYGQCWVFAGITTTLSRTLGIPARTITTFASAHDTDNSLTVDRFFNMNGEEIKGVNGDSIWNFHVWTEVWMARPDLRGRYRNRGWQVIDATPQEKIDNIFKMGPANVAAAKVGDVDLKYETPFLFSEVNADQISWVKDYQTGRWRKINVITNGVGLLILTKSKSRPGSYDFNPIELTPAYKFREGSQEERDSIINAGKKMNLEYLYDPSFALRKTKGDITFEFKTENKQNLGDEIVVSYMVKNRANKERTVKLNLNLKSVYYSGRDGEVLKKVEEEIVLKPKEIKNLTFTVSPEEYLEKKVEFDQFKLTGFIRVIDTETEFVDEATLVLLKPKLNVNLEKPQIVDRKSNVNLKLKNPFRNQPLTNCKIIVKESNLNKKIEKRVNDIPSNGELNLNLSLQPNKEGKGITTFLFDCQELHDVRTSVPYNVIAN